MIAVVWVPHEAVGPVLFALLAGCVLGLLGATVQNNARPGSGAPWFRFAVWCTVGLVTLSITAMGGKS